jgi:uncharacterized membrane protein
MMGGWGEMAAAFGVFLVSHAVPARPPVRSRLVAGLGRRGYLIAYIGVSLAALAWLIAAAGQAPYVPLWPWAPWQRWVPNVAMPIVCLLIAFGTATPNPLSFGGRHNERFDPVRPGVVGVTRHPLLWALVLWAMAHMVPNGDLAHVLLFGGFAGFALLGMVMLDRRRRGAMGAPEWRRLTRRAPLVPGATLRHAALPAPRGPLLPRLAIALAIWLALIGAHPLVIHAEPLPFGV